MSDAELRELERRWRATGSAADEAALLLAQVRAGVLTPEELRLRAYLEQPGAALAHRGEPRPRSLDPNPELERWLDSLRHAQGVVWHFLFEGPGDPVNPAAHELVARHAAALYGTAARNTLAPTVGARIDLAAFFGERFDLARRQLLFPGGTASQLLPAREAEEARRAAGGYGGSLCGGYAYAFTEPPYSLHLDLPSTQELFVGLWEALVGTWDPDALVVFSWTTDQLPGFEAGQDWWGSFLWTLAPRDGRPWVAIAASETD